MQIETLDERKMIYTNSLLDTSASGIFVNEEWAKRQNFNFIPIDCPIPVRNADGTLNSGGYIKNRIEFMLRVGTHQEQISADVTNLGGKQKLILVRRAIMLHPKHHTRTMKHNRAGITARETKTIKHRMALAMSV
jgi:hypothetical protein